LNKLSISNNKLFTKNYVIFILRILSNVATRFSLLLNKLAERTLNPLELMSANTLFNSLNNSNTLPIAKWINGILLGSGTVISAIIKSIAGIIGSGVSSILFLINTLISFSIEPALQGLTNLLITIAGGIISILSNLFILIARVVGLLSEGRQLSEDEKNILRVVFRTSLNPNKIRIAYFPFWHKYFFALHNTIYSPHKDQSIPPHLLVHESVHVWQYHHEGTKYLAEALLAQVQYGIKNIPGNAYDWTAELSRGKTDWGNFNKEAAAQLIEEIWKEGEACIPSNEAEPLEVENGCGVFFIMSAEEDNRKPRFISKRNHQDYTDLAIESMLMLRSKK
jgi:hypothetical protein